MTASIERASPLSSVSGRLAAGIATSAAFSLRELPFMTQIDLRGSYADKAFLMAVNADLGCPLAAANTWSGDPLCATLWLGPDEWLIVTEDGRDAPIERALRHALGGLHYSITDVSASRVILEISGKNARTVLAKGCSLDLHAQSFTPLKCAQTLLAKAQIILQCMDDRPTFRLYVRNSFAHYVVEWLLDAAAEVSASEELDGDRIATRLK